ncbi:type II pantothenate kinase [Paenibacillus sp. TRM 82003]|nr:type II pantothenate kinase [Paenibacillus sp. TRM 82003]
MIKIAYQTADGFVGFTKFPTSAMAEAVRWIESEHPGASLCATGGKASILQERLGRETGQLVEFEATVNGVRWLLERERRPMEKFLLTNVGTGTSIHSVDGETHYRVGGTGVGGGTLVGLAAMTTGVTAYDDIVRLASAGSRESIDLKVNHIYEGAVPPIPGELTASNFGRWLQTGGSASSEDRLASVIGLVGETVATVSVHAAGQCGAKTVLYIGSSFIRNELLRKVVADYTELRGSAAFMVPNGEYSGALGALRTLMNT